MPPIVIAGALAAGGAVAGAAISGSATKKATDAATQSSNQNAQIQQQMYQQTRSDLAPATATLAPTTGALMQRLGLAPQAANTGAAPAPAGGYMDSATPTANLGYGDKTGYSTMPPQAPQAAGGALSQAQLQQITTDRPDVAAEYQKAQANGSAQQRGLNSQDAYVADWYSRVRPAMSDGYQLPASNPTSAQPTTPATPPPPIPGQTMTSADNGGLGPRAPQARPDFAQPQPTYTDPTFGAAPSSATYVDPANFTTSPGYQFRLDQGLRADNANYAARGLLKSDAAVKGLNDYSQGMASSEYGNWFNQQMQRYGADANQFNTDRASTLGQFNTDRTTGLAQYNQNRNVFNQNYNTDAGRYDANFNADRGYNTDQYNTYTGNLFSLAGMGQNAAAGTASAGQNYASQATANNNSLASVRGNAAIAGANGVNGVISSGLGAVGMATNPFSVSGSGAPPVTAPAGGYTFGSSYNLTSPW